jgi:hemerythrin
MKNSSGIPWDDRYLVGIQVIDEQHRELIRLFNELYMGCMKGTEGDAFFSNNVHDLVNYMIFHFSTEEEFLEKIRYPDLAAHKMQHKIFIADVLERIDTLEPGRANVDLVINYFHDWIVTHFSLIDRKYATYIHIIRSHEKFQDAPLIQSLVSVYGTPMRQSLPTEVFIG